MKTNRLPRLRHRLTTDQMKARKERIYKRKLHKKILEGVRLG